MYIKKINMKNFRIFRGTHEFILDEKQLIIVEGPNGHGKSTIFDAINWCISGKINRYTGSTEKNNFSYIINSDALKKGINEAHVEIIFQTEDKRTICIKRIEKKDATNKLFIDNQEMNLREGQKSIISLLIKKKRKEDLNDTDENNNLEFDLISFIESTLILSQENLEEFVRGNKPIERFKIIERVLGLTKYGVDFKEYLNEFKKYCILEIEKNDKKLNEVFIKKGLLDQENKMLIVHSGQNMEKSKVEIIENIKKIKEKYKSEELILNIQMNDEDKIDDNELFSRLQDNLKYILEKVNHEKKTFERLNDFYHAKNLSVDTSNSLIKINNMKEKIRLIEKNILQRDNGMIQAFSKKELMNNFKQLNNVLARLKIDKEKNNKKIEDTLKLKEEIMLKFNLEFSEDFKSDIKFYTEIKDYLQYLLDVEIIFDLKRKEGNLQKNINELKEDLNVKKIKINEVDSKINEVVNEISLFKNQKNDKVELEFRNLIHQVQLSLLDSPSSECLVCGTEFKDNNELNFNINSQINKTVTYISEIDKNINELIEKQNVFLKTKSDNQNQMNDLYDQIDKLESELQIINSHIKNRKIEAKINIENYDLLILQKNNVDEFLKKNEDRFLALLKLKELSEELKQETFEKKDILNKIDNYINMYSEKKIKPYLYDNKKIERMIEKIDLYLKQAKQNIKTNYEEINMLLSRINDFETKINQLDEIRVELINYFKMNVNLDSKEIYKELIDELNLLNDIYLYVNSIVNDINLYKSNYQLRENEKNKKLNNIEENKLINRKIEITNKLSQLNDFLKYHSTNYSSLINNYLVSISKEVNNYYRQISPHSYFNYVSLKTQDNALYIILQEQLDFEKEIENIDINASLTLSAAQSTVLAMSIFLALNKSQNMSNLNMIGIDDPFQNLDDINSYSFIDLISNLISKEKRQVLISTHDSNFGNLTMKKMNMDTSKIAYIKIESYTKEAIEINSKSHQQLELN